MKILFVVPYPLRRSPSQRFRFEQYFGILSSSGLQFDVESFYDEASWDIIYNPGNTWRKTFALIKGFLKRALLMTAMRRYDGVFLHREAAPLGPPLFEWIIAKLWKKKMIYDFDDAIWTTDNVNEGALERMIRWRSKVQYTCRVASVVSAGNDYLAAYASQFNRAVVVNPTTIDITYHSHRTTTPGDRVVIGWTGSHSTLKYLDALVPVISELEKKYQNIVFRVIANHNPSLPLRSFEFLKWSEQNEIDDLSGIDIGVMPLPNDEWSKGKCGFKALQYMSLQIPAVVSPVGVNSKIISDGVNGFLCGTSAEWMARLTKLIDDQSLRRRMGEAGKQTVEQRYSVVSNAVNFLSLFGLSASNTRANP